MEYQSGGKLSFRIVNPRNQLKNQFTKDNSLASNNKSDLQLEQEVKQGTCTPLVHITSAVVHHNSHYDIEGIFHNEQLYKLIDSSQLLVQVLDARNPLGTRCNRIEEYLKREVLHTWVSISLSIAYCLSTHLFTTHIYTQKPEKSMILVLNKCDLVPCRVTAQWIETLSKEYPTIAYDAQNPDKSFGKGTFYRFSL